MSIGLNIKRLRKELGFTQKALADILELTEGQISHYEKDRSTPPVEVIDRMARALGVRVSDIIGNNNYSIEINNETYNKIIESKPVLNNDELAKELIIVNRKYQELLEKGNADKDRIIELLDKVRELEKKLNTGT